MPTCAYCGKHHPTDDWQCPPCTCGHAEPDHQRQTGRVGNACGECACAQYAPSGDPVPPEGQPRIGELKLEGGVLRRWGGMQWTVVPLAAEPVRYLMNEAGVWYLPRNERGALHLEACADDDLMKLPREERAVLAALLRCAVYRLEHL